MPKSYAYWREYLSKAKNGYSRPINGSSTKRVIHGDSGDVRLSLHNTDVVTIRPTGHEVVRHDGWNTVTTRRFLTEYSKASVWSEKGQWYVRVRDPEVTSPKVWKCRTCHGAGKLPQECHGPSWCAEHYRPGMSDKRCSHGELRPVWGVWPQHRTDVCVHGQTEGHELAPVECWRCDGSGRFDYGSKQIHYAWNGEPLLIDSDGYAVGPVLAKPGSNPKPDVPAVRESYDDSGTLLLAVLPGLNHLARCPHCSSDPGRLEDIIIHLNDGAKWTREQIADWLETLDVDLTFPVPDEIPAHVA